MSSTWGQEADARENEEAYDYEEPQRLASGQARRQVPDAGTVFSSLTIVGYLAGCSISS
jgi:hypothetical protein